MTIVSYLFTILIWLGGAYIFRYGVYPPKYMFWILIVCSSFIISGLTKDTWAGVKITLFVWILIPIFRYFFYAPIDKLIFSIILSLILAIFVGYLGAKIDPRLMIKGLSFFFVLIFIIISIFYMQIEKAGEMKPLNKSDAAIVLGAAVWEGGRPSPSMYARVKEAVKLYHEGFVRKLIVSGGLGRFPPTEAEVMRDVAISLKVPKEDIILETEAKSTFQNISNSAYLGEKQGLKNYIIVTDAFHIKRSLLIGEELDLNVQGAAAFDSPLYTNKKLKFKYTLREAFGLIKFYARGFMYYFNLR